MTPGTYAGLASDWLTLVANFKPGIGGLDCFSTFAARSLGKTRGVRNAAAILEMELETIAVQLQLVIIIIGTTFRIALSNINFCRCW